MSKFTNTGNIIVDEAFRNWIGSGDVPGNIEFGERLLVLYLPMIVRS